MLFLSIFSGPSKPGSLMKSGLCLPCLCRGVFDISLIASIASHLSYWADEDVCHFMISQLLSRQRVMQR